MTSLYVKRDSQVHGSPDSRLVKMLGILAKRYGIECDVSLEELISYLNAPSYEEDTISLDEILSEELLFLHEVAEICLLKSLGYKITRSTVLDAYPDTYRAHLEAMDIELAEASRRGRLDWITKRCKDLGDYLSDPYLPPSLQPMVHLLIRRYCRRSSGALASRE